MKNVTLEQLLVLIGAKEVEIFLLKEDLSAAQKRIAELEKKTEFTSHSPTLGEPKP